MQLQIRSFHVVERTRTSAKCTYMKIVCAKHAEPLFFNMQICDVVVAVIVVFASVVVLFYV